MRRCCEIRLRIACVPCTCFITPNRCPCLMRTLPCVAICRNATTRRAARNHASLSPLPRQYGAKMGRAWTTDGRNAPRTTESITDKDYVAFFHQFLGLTNNPALAPFANVPCRCTRYLMGSDGAWDHVSSCLQHASNWTCAHDHVWRALESICNDAGFATCCCLFLQYLIKLCAWGEEDNGENVL